MIKDEDSEATLLLGCWEVQEERVFCIRGPISNKNTVFVLDKNA